SIEPRPPPAITPQRVAGIPAIAILHHDEPALQSFGMTDRACRHFSSCCLIHLFYENGAIRKTSVAAIGRNGPGGCVHDMELLRTPTLVGCHRPASQRLIGGAIVGGHMQIPARF